MSCPHGERFGYCTTCDQEDEILSLKHRVTELEEALRWYVENDDTSVGQSGNEFYEEGLFKAQDLLGIPRSRPEDIDGD